MNGPRVANSAIGDERGVSDAQAVLLLLTVAILIAAVLGTFVLFVG